jgi:hypothetical protein
LRSDVVLLGDMLARFEDETIATEAILALGDLALIARLRDAADAEGETLGAFAAAAVRRYAADASDEEWVTLIGLLGRAADPGSICLQRALAHAIAEFDQAQGPGSLPNAQFHAQ